MALVFLDSFDHYATADILTKWSGASSSNTINSTAGRRAGGALLLSNVAGINKTGLVTSGSLAILGMAVKFSAAPTTTILFGILSGGTVQVAVTMTSAGFLEIRRGGTSGTLYGTWSTSVALNQYYFFELRVLLHATLGSVLLRANEVPVIEALNVNTSVVGTTWNGIVLQGPSGVSGTYNFDDLYVLDGSGPSPTNNLIGDCRVDARFPQDMGTSHAWAPTTSGAPSGNNATTVDDSVPDGDASYNATATIGATDTFIVQDVPVPGAAFYGVQLVTSQKKTDAGTCSIAPVVRCADVSLVIADRVGPSFNPGTGYNYQLTPYSLNPGTGLPWTEDEFNAAEFGYQRTA